MGRSVLGNIKEHPYRLPEADRRCRNTERPAGRSPRGLASVVSRRSLLVARRKGSLRSRDAWAAVRPWCTIMDGLPAAHAR